MALTEDSIETPVAGSGVKSLKQHLGHLEDAWRGWGKSPHKAPAEGSQMERL